MFGRVAIYGISLLPVSDVEELSVRANAVPSNTIRSECVDVLYLLSTELSVIVACSSSSYCT